jgi:hypothetical protein
VRITHSIKRGIEPFTPPFFGFLFSVNAATALEMRAGFAPRSVQQALSQEQPRKEHDGHCEHKSEAKEECQPLRPILLVLQRDAWGSSEATTKRKTQNPWNDPWTPHKTAPASPADSLSENSLLDFAAGPPAKRVKGKKRNKATALIIVPNSKDPVGSKVSALNCIFIALGWSDFWSTPAALVRLCGHKSGISDHSFIFFFRVRAPGWRF